MKDFNGKVALITGGASGVGRSLAFALGKRGANVVVGDVDKAAMEQIAEDLAEAGIASRLSSAMSPVSTASVPWPIPPVTLSAASIWCSPMPVSAPVRSGAMWDYSEKDWQWCFNVNVWGVINSIRAFMPRLVASGEAHFVVTGSGNGACIITADRRSTPPARRRCTPSPKTCTTRCRRDNCPLSSARCSQAPTWSIPACSTPGGCVPEELSKGSDGNESGINSVDDMKAMAAEWGIELQTTHPDEVAEMAVRGIEAGRLLAAGDH